MEAWGNLAETLKNYTSKGALVDLIGEFHNNNYEDKEGNKRYEIVFQVEYLELLESRAVSEARKRNNQGSR
ncbi:single-stranded DNA-binding protein [Enterococcus termitis]